MRLFHNILDIAENLASSRLITPRLLHMRTEKILFYFSEREKETSYMIKMAKKIQKSITNARVVKIFHRENLIEKITKMSYSIIVIGSEGKELEGLIDLCERIEAHGLEDRVIFIKRESEISERTIEHIEKIVIMPKHVKV